MTSLYPKYGWMRAGWAGVLCALCLLPLSSCTENKNPPLLPARFNVSLFSLSPDGSNIIGNSVPLEMNVDGCGNVSQAQVLYVGESEQPIVNVAFSPEKHSAKTTLETKHFTPFYPQHGIAVHLSLKARAKCEDGRVSDSLPLSISFLPVTSTFKPETGIAATDHFVAIGGINGTPTTFLGCSKDVTQQTFSLVHFDAENNLHSEINFGTNPLACNASTQISNPVNGGPNSGYRWAYTLGEDGRLFAFRLQGKQLVLDAAHAFPGLILRQFSMDSEGNAFVVVSSTKEYALFRLSPVANQARNFVKIPFSETLPSVAFPSPPLLLSGGIVLLPMWNVPMNATRGRLEIHSFTLNNDVLEAQCGVNEIGMPANPCPPIENIEFNPYRDVPMAPAAVLSKDGLRLFLAPADPNHNISDTPYAVVSYELKPSVDAASRHLYQPSLLAGGRANLFESPVTKLSLSKDGRFLVASTDTSIRFLDTTQGRETLPLGKPLTVSGKLYVTEHIHGPQGSGDSLILLNSPFFSPGDLFSKWLFGENFGWPTEAIAIDSPEKGELWRFSYGGSGDQPLNAIAVAIDEGGQMWMRRGAELVQLLPQTTYRNLRTP
ncbi:MAG: hypothetical protein FWD46_08460 [Cystobacterineae bacterium]|nr:hypothetical protein [Cystobacterineae bacterium]